MVIESGTVGNPAYSKSLPRIPESAGDARLLVSAALDAWGLPSLKGDAHLVVTELVSNAVAHARRETIRVTVTRLDVFRVEVAVTDLSRAAPQMRPAVLSDSESGRGLSIVAALTDGKWDSEPKNWGKRVWAQLTAGGSLRA
ncbi:ATP-binding protein [Streptomyces sp. H27-C3]|uniref:ATP-binding protein n=1 Tax=Streptomyces sp. H27-C3 TaxID=3046305 RepID=UPI0024B89427|nr:ATP-binding protein [Streptomyces sp. H27-C3]MDJ0460430.1 ATP-binding protein [Streptomyces sp. H27-C3]